MDGQPQIDLREVRPDDGPGLVACFNRVFSLEDATAERLDEELWRWKFPDNPSGRLHITVADHPERGIVGAYPCQPMRFWMDGRIRFGAHGVDQMVEREFRRYGPRPGLFVALGLLYHELYCGRDDDQDVFTYGWPVPGWRVGQRYLDWENVRDFLFLGRELAGDEGSLQKMPGELEVAEVESFGAETDALFDAVKRDMGMAIVRDAAYLDWRYARHPRRSYRMYECRERRTGKLRGIAVYTVADFMRPDTAYLVDWVVDGADVDAIAALVGTAERRALVDRTGAIAGIWNPVDPRFGVLQGMGYLTRDSGYFTAIRRFDYDTYYFRNNWIYTLGDSDLV